MYFTAGAVLLVLAVTLMCFARLASVHGHGPRALQEFTRSASVALVITTLYAFGFGAMAGGIAAKPTVAGFAELGIAIAAVTVTTAVIVRLTRRLAVARPAVPQKAAV